MVYKISAALRVSFHTKSVESIRQGKVKAISGCGCGCGSGSSADDSEILWIVGNSCRGCISTALGAFEAHRANWQDVKSIRRYVKRIQTRIEQFFVLII